MSRKLLLCLPFSPHEIPQARELAKLWTDLEDSFNNDITVAIVSRYDIEPTSLGQDIIDYLKIKFNVILHKNRREGKGWPRGCNQLEIGAYEWFVESNRNKQFDFDYMMLAEPDTVPLRKGWANEIMNEAYDQQALIIGAYFVKEDGYAHINGNCVIHRDFWKYCKTIWSCSPFVGWDVNIGPWALRMGKPSRLIWQDYRLGAPDNPWRGDDYLFSERCFKTPQNPLYGQVLRPAFVHGIKTMQGIEAVRKRILQKDSESS
jgi:hypothetical protein